MPGARAPNCEGTDVGSHGSSKAASGSAARPMARPSSLPMGRWTPSRSRDSPEDRGGVMKGEGERHGPWQVAVLYLEVVRHHLVAEGAVAQRELHGPGPGRGEGGGGAAGEVFRKGCNRKVGAPEPRPHPRRLLRPPPLGGGAGVGQVGSGARRGRPRRWPPIA